VRGLESVFGVAASLLSLAGPVLVDVSSASASSVHIIRLGNGSNGATVRASVGTQVVVDLQGSSSTGETWAWTVPVSSNQAVLALKSSGRDARGDAWADFVARSSGRARVTSSKSCRPARRYACPMVVILWRAAVRVVS
jgi:hypothetical protein